MAYEPKEIAFSQKKIMLPRSSLIIILLFFTNYWLYAQSLTSDLITYNQISLNHQKTAMLVLGGWAVTNIGTGLALRSSTEGTSRRFHEMNALWNTVNLAIAGFGYYTAVKGDPAAWDLATSLQKHDSFQKILLFNAGLDVGYVLGGLYLTERAKRPGVDSDQLKGYGQSIMLQGGFLFVFDVVNYVVATKLNGALPIVLGSSGDGIGLLYTF